MKKLGLRLSIALNVLLIGLLAFAAWTALDFLSSFTRQLFERRQTQFEQLHPSGGIVFVGDSITEGGIWYELFQRADVWNRGIGGDTTAGVLSRMDTLVAIEPRQVFLMIGVNDLNQGVPTDRTLANYEEILATFERELPGTEVIVQSLLPVTPEWPAADNDDIRALNREIRAFAEARGLRYVDLQPLFADEHGDLAADLSNDGIHLLGPAYLRWRDRIAPLLEPANRR